MSGPALAMGRQKARRARSRWHLLIRSDFAAAAEECNLNLSGIVGREAEEEGADNLALLERFRPSGCHGSRRR